MKRLLILILALALVLSFAGCDEIFVPVETTVDPNYTNPYINWEETEPPATTVPVETTEPTPEGELGFVSGKRVNLRSGPGVSYESLGMLYYGTEVRILEQRALDGVRWGLTEDGWVCMDYITLSSGVPILLGTITTNVLNVREGPGTSYDVVDTVKRGEEVSILEQQSVNGKAWGRIVTGWISMDYVNVIGSIEGDPEVTEPVEQEIDSSIFGVWISMEEQLYLSGQPTQVSTWTFRKNGSYTRNTRSISYTEDGGWRFSGEGKQHNGTYTFDGKNLVTEEETINVSIENDFMKVYSHRTHSVMLRTQDVNLLIRELVKNSGKQSNTSLNGSWAAARKQEDGSAVSQLWYFGSDGSFSCTITDHIQGEAGFSAVSTVIHTGVYFFDGNRLTLCYEVVTNNNTLDTTVSFRCVVRTAAVASSVLTFAEDNTALQKDASVQNLLASLT